MGNLFVFRELMGKGGFDQSTKEGFCAGIRFRTFLPGAPRFVFIKEFALCLTDDKNCRRRERFFFCSFLSPLGISPSPSGLLFSSVVPWWWSWLFPWRGNCLEELSIGSYIASAPLQRRVIFSASSMYRYVSFSCFVASNVPLPQFLSPLSAVNFDRFLPLSPSQNCFLNAHQNRIRALTRGT